MFFNLHASITIWIHPQSALTANTFLIYKKIKNVTVQDMEEVNFFEIPEDSDLCLFSHGVNLARRTLNTTLREVGKHGIS